MHEVLSVQVGPYANLVGAHFWNLQEGQDDAGQSSASTLFRGGQTEEGSQTLMPRMLLFDREENLGALRPGGYVYRQDAYCVKEARKAVPWSGKVEVHCTERVATRNELLQEAGQRGAGGMEVTEGGGAEGKAACSLSPYSSSWSEVVRRHYHPRSTVPVRLQGEGGMAEWREEVGGDRMRQFLEECDAPQGLHLLSDLSAPFLPLLAGCVRDFRQEAGSAGITCLAFDMQPPQAQGGSTGSKVEAVLDRIASAMTIKELLQAEALVLPLGSRQQQPGAQQLLPGLHGGEWGHTSALLACAMDVATGIYCAAGRQEDRRILMRDWIQAVCAGGNSIGSVEVSAPLPGPHLSLQQLRDLMQPSDPRTVLLPSSPPQGLLRHIMGLWPAAPAHEPEDAMRRFTSLVSLRGTGGVSSYAALDAINDAIKYYPWNMPHMTHARSQPLPIYQPSFPVEIFGGDARSCGLYTMVGCTTAVVPYLRSLTEAVRLRSPLVKTRLLAGQGLLDEDLAEVEDVILTHIEQFEG